MTCTALFSYGPAPVPANAGERFMEFLPRTSTATRAG
jgi:hypothetical protein